MPGEAIEKKRSELRNALQTLEARAKKNSSFLPSPGKYEQEAQNFLEKFMSQEKLDKIRLESRIRQEKYRMERGYSSYVNQTLTAMQDTVWPDQ